LKFVLLTQCYPPEIGGAQVLLGSVAAELKRRGHEVRVVTALPNYPTGKIFPSYRGRLFLREDLDGIPVFRTWIYAVQSAGLLPRLANYFSFCITSLVSFRWMGRPDVIFVDSPPLFLCLTALLLARLKGARWVMNVSDLWPDAVADSGLVQSGLLLRIARRLESFLYRSADYVSSVTEGIRKILLEEKGVPRTKLLFLPIGVDTALFQPAPADQVLLEQLKLMGKSVFTYAGRVGHSQGLSLVIKAANQLRSRKDIAFVFLGDGPVKEQLRRESAQLGLTNVFFMDPVPLSEMPRWWSITRGALVTLKDQPIHFSARPSKSLPAMASGVPVIFSGVGEMARIISDANAGLVVPPEQVEPLVQSILRLADDPALARELGLNGRQLCEQEFSWRRVLQSWLNEMSIHAGKGEACDATSNRGQVDAI
jgi:colanic acid biosynthesis glycosyl transferase WcaI